jgi:hypothetical protein
MANVEPIAKERDRLLHRSARVVGLGSTIVALISFSVPGVLPWTSYLATLPLFVLLIFALYRMGIGQSTLWVILGLASGLAILLVAQVPNGHSETTAVVDAMVPLAGAALGAFAMVLTGTVPRLLVLVVGAALAFTLVQLASPRSDALSSQAVSVIVGWILAGILGYWLSASVPRAARRIFSIGRAHRAERQVTASALQQQAGDDARLLRQLRLGASPVPQSSGSYNLEQAEESILGTTLESVKQRFGRMGLEVSWHGTGQVLLPSDVLDAFLLALAECLENVRRHAGVTDAHVTITDDETTVRAMVTDAGVGFDLKDIDEARLGFKDSVVGRLQEVGGNARLFSSPGSGTTVVLEVPK